MKKENSMKKHLQLKILVFSIVFFASCKGQNQIDQSNNTLRKTSSFQVDRTYISIEGDTVITTQAPSQITRKIRKDAEGNLIIASFEDIILYDGKSFRKLDKPDSHESFDAFDAFQDSKGNLWIGSTHFGVFIYDGKTFTHLTEENGLAGNRTIDIHEDKAGNIWISTLNGASKYDGDSFHNYTTANGLPDNDVNSIQEDQNGNVWIGTRSKACIFDGKSFSLITDDEGNHFLNTRYIIEDSNGNIWLGGKGGLWKYDRKTFTRFSKPFVGYIYEDSKGNIWTSSQSEKTTGWALTCYENAVFSQNGIKATEINTYETMLFGISEDKAGNIWVGTLKGVFKYDGKRRYYFKNKDY